MNCPYCGNIISQKHLNSHVRYLHQKIADLKLQIKILRKEVLKPHGFGHAVEEK